VPTEDAGIRRLILASGSPRRRQLLSLLGLPFVIKVAGVDERQDNGESPRAFVRRMSEAKACAARGEQSANGSADPLDLVVAADTIVVLPSLDSDGRDGEVLGKPEDAAEATAMLRRLRGRQHLVYTGVTVWHPATDRLTFELGESIVWMRDYDEEEIGRYVASGDPMDKAGAYAIQHPEFDPVSRVDGCWLNVVGLPLCHLGRALRQMGVTIPADVPGSCQAFSQVTCPIHRDILPAD
jgi:septum formation protein